ncbi:MAG: hypothetical protein AMJ69_00445 [Gammaproteobacteria bacterium SG8_47]|nr:MAG: hypothetical protein AMJ69_00445 [Gammaproteobacteria bacterium SG8_47]
MPGGATKHIDVSGRRTKIVATLGPASSSARQIKALLEAGVDVVRLNMSHGSHDEHRALVARVRAAARRLGRHVAVLADLCGPKIRVGRFADGTVRLVDGKAVSITTRNLIGTASVIPSQYRRLPRDVRKGERVFLDDGKLQLIVERVRGETVHCRVVHGGLLRDNKGMNLPDTRLSVGAFTAKDRRDAALAVEMGVDLVALSFVRSARDIKQVQRYLLRLGADIPVIAKIEKPEALGNIDAILAESYGIMVARGDLGIELAAERVPLIQRELIEKARIHNRPVIVATQMLESMIERPSPTRAEVGDVAGAALSSADAVMLSGETAVGAYPVAAVQTMDRVVREIEAFQWRRGSFVVRADANTVVEHQPIREAVAHAALNLARDLRLRSIVIPTNSGATARIIAAERPLALSLGVCAKETICRRLALHWGVIPVLVPVADVRDWRRLCRAISKQCSLTAPGSAVLIVSGFNEQEALNEPVLKLMQL